MTQFKHSSSFNKFRDEVSRQWRYVRTNEAEDFLRTVASTCKERVRIVAKDTRYWRAQRDCVYEASPDEAGLIVAVPHPPSRMKPRRDCAVEGRANPKGIPILYLATTARAAISEVRPWVGAMVSVAEFEILRPLTIVDCSLFHDSYHTILEPFDKLPPEKTDEFVWATIDHAFAEPVTQADETADYASTQTLAELFRREGYDGITYKSLFGVEAYSIALFDLDCASQIGSKLYRTKGMNMAFEEYHNDPGMLQGILKDGRD
jgi:hypothetical protein